MGVYKRGRIWWMSFSHNGQQYRRPCDTSSKKEAEEIFFKVKSQIREGKFFEVQARDTSFEEMAEELVIDYRINVNAV